MQKKYQIPPKTSEMNQPGTFFLDFCNWFFQTRRYRGVMAFKRYVEECTQTENPHDQVQFTQKKKVLNSLKTSKMNQPGTFHLDFRNWFCQTRGYRGVMAV